MRGGAPSGFPYPLVDRVLEMDPGVRAVAAKVVSANEPYFVGHFPGTPVFPGVLLCEALAQLGAAVAGDDEGLVLGNVERARFRRPVLPGDALRLEVTSAAAGRFRGVVVIADDQTVVAEVQFTMAAARGPRIHPTAVVSPRAALADGVRVGAYAVIGPQVTLGPDCWIGPHAVVDGRTTLGARNRVFQFASVGSMPQDLKFRGEASTLTMGDGNIVREYVSINPGTEGGGMETRIGSGCLFMVSSHVAHDCRLGDSVILANGSALGGHVVVDSHAIVGGLAGVHQFVRVGESALCAAGAMVSRDAPPFCTVAGDRARLYGLNLVGLKRRGLPEESIRALKRAYRMLFHGGETRRVAAEHVQAELGAVPEVARLLAFVAASERGVCRSPMERIGLIAGSGRFPVLFAETARRRGVEVIAVAHRGETAEALAEVVHSITWVVPGQVDALIKALTDAGVTRAVMVGGIAKPKLFREFVPDARALAVISRLGAVRDDLLLRALADELASEGIQVVESTLYLRDIVPGPGVLTAREPTPAEWDDIRLGFRAAKVIGQFDIGQSVVVRLGTVMAVEGIEGTDATIRRAGQLVNGDIVVVKACKPTQDLRFDLPAIGPDTIRTIAEVRGRVLAVEAGRTIVLDRTELVALADDAGVAVVAVNPAECVG